MKKIISILVVCLSLLTSLAAQTIWKPIEMEGLFLGVSADGSIFSNCGYSGLHRSQDDGATWELNYDLSYVSSNHFTINDNNRIFIFNQNNYKLYYSGNDYQVPGIDSFDVIYPKVSYAQDINYGSDLELKVYDEVNGTLVIYLGWEEGSRLPVAWIDLNQNKVISIDKKFVDNVLKNTTGYSQKLKAYLNIISVLNHVMRVAANIILLTFIEKNMRKY